MEYPSLHITAVKKNPNAGLIKPASLSVTNLSWSAKKSARPIVQAINFELRAGRVLGILGPNGAGKTSLLRLLYRFYRPTTGEIRLNGRDIWALSARSVAQQIAAVLQEQPQDFGFTVSEIVGLGRVPHRRGFNRSHSPHDKEIIFDALDRLELIPFADRRLGTLSGGERQRVMVARALAQEPQLLILDEPTNHLDIRHQLEVIELIKGLPLTIVTSLHDLNMAMGVCDDVLLLQSGRSLGFGPPSEVLSEEAVSGAFNVVSKRDRLSSSNAEHLAFYLRKENLFL